MISLIGFLLILGLIVFGPKKTIEMAQEAGRMLAQVKHAAGQLQQSAMDTNRGAEPDSTPSPRPAVPPHAPAG